LNDEELVALIFYLSNGRIRGLTRLNKIIFLLQDEFKLDNFSFVAFKYGPWSKELDSLVNSLTKRGLIKIEKTYDLAYSFLQEKPVKILIASSQFLKIGKEVFEEIRRKDFVLATLLKRRVLSYSTVPITYLLAYIYSKYPSFMTNSIIKERIKAWKKFYGLEVD